MYKFYCKALLLLCLLIAISNNSYAQTSRVWQNNYGTNATERGTSVVLASDGNYVLLADTDDGLGAGADQPIVLMKVNTLGNVLWTQSYGFGLPDLHEGAGQLVATPDGGYLICGWMFFLNTADRAYLIKTDANGNLEWNRIYNGTEGIFPRDVIVCDNGDYAFVGQAEINDSTYLMAGRVAPNGDLRWIKEYQQGIRAESRGYSLKENDSQELILVGHVIERIGTSKVCEHLLTVKTDATGELIWVEDEGTINCGQTLQLFPNGEILVAGDVQTGGTGKLTRLTDDGTVLNTLDFSIAQNLNPAEVRIQPTSEGGYIMAGNAVIGGRVLAFMMERDQRDSLEWINTYDFPTPITASESGSEAIQTPDGGFLMVGWTTTSPNSPSSGAADVYLVKTDSLGELFINLIQGRVVRDTSLDCVVDFREEGWAGWILRAADSSGKVFYSTTDSFGNYLMRTEPGNYTLSLQPTSPYYSVCQNDIAIDLSMPYQTDFQDFAVQAAIDCPLLTVDVSTSFLRRCFPNRYVVSYCNQGPATALDASLELDLDPFLLLDSASIPFSQSGTTLTFDLGDVASGTCERFDVYVTVDCDSTVLGQTHCVEARIFPDSLCLPANSSWSGAFIEVGAQCQDTSLKFSIQNTGGGAMSGPLNYVIIEDAILLRSNSFQLGSGAAEDISLPNNGSTYLLYAEQEPGAPGSSTPILAIEGCVDLPGAPFSTGFVTQFSQNDADPFVDIDCRQNRGSFDPNDKQGFPTGYGAANFIEANTEIEYLIRFQNTGTDTAFKVVIRDTLSPWLDPTSIQLGSASHPYEFQLSEGGILEFTFNNIMLPDSNVNLLASNGFVKFRIAQQPDNPIGTEIENTAAIFFDFNLPIFTNTTLHTIGEDLIDMILDTEGPAGLTASAIKVFPNPLRQSGRLEWTGQGLEEGQFELYTISGQLIRTDRFSGTQYEFIRGDLAAGLYFFRIQDQGAVIAKGKIIIH
ncbi:MAG: T9SS type A sorting domain-containing protein [Bacteroidota bacterium]